MRVLPATCAAELAVGGSAIVLVGAILSQSMVVAWGAAVLLGLCLGRAAALIRVSVVRKAGLEMTWREVEKVSRFSQSVCWELGAHLSNRDTRPIQFRSLRCLAAGELNIEMSPSSGEVPAKGSLRLSLRGNCQRVGCFGVWGLALQLRGESGLFEVPLTFASPVGVEILPRQPSRRKFRPGLAALNQQVQGAVSNRKHTSPEGEFSELRDHQWGDSFRSIAWKASARRGKLVTRKYQQEQSGRVWFIVDASVELWSGQVGAAPLDVAIEAVCQRISHHLLAGEAVGLAVVHGTEVVRVEPKAGRGQWAALRRTLAKVPSTGGGGRSGWDDVSLCRTVLEHLRMVAPQATAQLKTAGPADVLKLSLEQMRRGPFYNARAWKHEPASEVLHGYLAAFGVQGPPPLQPQYRITQSAIASLLKSISLARERMTTCYMASPLPDETAAPELIAALHARRRQSAPICWLHCRDCVRLNDSAAGAQLAELAAQLATEVRVQHGEKLLRSWGVRRIECLPAPERRLL